MTSGNLLFSDKKSRFKNPQVLAKKTSTNTRNIFITIIFKASVQGYDEVRIPSQCRLNRVFLVASKLFHFSSFL